MPNDKKRLWRKGETYYDTNPQANAIVERVHQTIGNMIRTFELYDNDGIDDDDPWSGILATVMAAVRSTYSTKTQATPMQLVFGRDATINTKFITDWDYIRQRKQISYIIIMTEKTRSEFRTRIKLAIRLC